MTEPEIIDHVVSFERDRISRIYDKRGRGEALTSEDRIAYYTSLQRSNEYSSKDMRNSPVQQRRYALKDFNREFILEGLKRNIPTIPIRHE